MSLQIRNNIVHQVSHTGQLEIPPVFQKYMILITIICVSKHSTAIANKKLGSTTRHTIQSPFLILFGQKKKKKRRMRGPQAGCTRGQETFFFLALHWGQCFTEPCKTYVCDAKPCICSTIIIIVLALIVLFFPLGSDMQ